VGFPFSQRNLAPGVSGRRCGRSARPSPVGSRIFLLFGGENRFLFNLAGKYKFVTYPRAMLWTVRPSVTDTAFAHFLLFGGKNRFLLNLAGKDNFVFWQGGAVNGPPARHRYGIRAFFYYLVEKTGFC
jgi:hypothetical protein